MVDVDPISLSAEIKGRRIDLDPLSFRLLSVLISRPNEFFSPKSINESVWPNNFVSNQTIRQRVFILRKLLQDKGVDPKLIQSARGEGYRFVEAIDVDSKTPVFTMPQKQAKDALKIGAASSVLILIVVLTFFVATYFDMFKERLPVGIWLNNDGNRSSSFSNASNLWVAKLSANEDIDLTVLKSDQGDPRTNELGNDFLLSIWEPTAGEDLVLASVVEPLSGKTLHSVILVTSDEGSVRAGTALQLDFLIALQKADVLPPKQEALNDPNHSYWRNLVQLASKY